MKGWCAGGRDLCLALLAYLTCANASIVSGKGRGKYSFAKAERIPKVGVDGVRRMCDPLVSECKSTDEQVQDKLIVALEADEHTTGERAFTPGVFADDREKRGTAAARNRTLLSINSSATAVIVQRCSLL